MTTSAHADAPALPSYARDAEHAAEIAAHIKRLVDEAPEFTPAQCQRLKHLLRPDATTTAAETAA